MKVFGRNSHFFRKEHGLSGTLTLSKHVQTTESLREAHDFEEFGAESEVKRATEEETTEEKAVEGAHSFEEFGVKG
jgi:hypothetical protein